MHRVVFVVLVGAKLINGENCSDFGRRMEEEGVVPDVIPTAPENVLQVTYQNGRFRADLGNKLEPNDLKEAPLISWKADSSSYYTVIMADPDAPSHENPSAAQWRHWLVVNIPGNDLASGQVLSEYNGPTPPKGSGLHRYVLLVYKQPSKMAFEEATLAKWPRNKFSVTDFVQKYNLQDPIAGNFYQAQTM